MNIKDYVEKHDVNSYPIWEEKRPFLGHLDIELTERCNNNCIHCNINLPEYDIQAKGRELSTDEWKDILKDAARLGVLRVCFTGGEPLLREDFEELYIYTRRLGINVLLFTNARLITPKLSDLFSKIPPREKIEITVYGVKKESYEAVSRIPGSFEEFIKGVNCLIERRVPFVVKGIVYPTNKREIRDVEDWATALPWMDRIPGYAMFFNLRGRRDSTSKNEMIRKLRINPEDALDILTRNPDKYKMEMVQFCSKFMGCSGDRLFECGAGQGVSIDAYGKVQPCLLLRMPELCYDIRKGSLKHALTKIFPQIFEIKAHNPNYLKRCARCFLMGLCEQCPAKSWSEHGTLDTPVEYLCKIAHAQARYLGLLAEQENAWEVEDGPGRVEKLQGTCRILS